MTPTLNKRFEVPFTQIDNNFLNNPDISFKVKGLYIFLLSKPDKWKFSIERIQAQTKDGRESIRSGLISLEDLGLLEREKVIGGMIYHILPSWENPTVVKPDGGETRPYSNKELKKEKLKEKVGGFELKNVQSIKKGTPSKQILDFFQWWNDHMPGTISIDRLKTTSKYTQKIQALLDLNFTFKEMRKVALYGKKLVKKKTWYHANGMEFDETPTRNLNILTIYNKTSFAEKVTELSQNAQDPSNPTSTKVRQYKHRTNADEWLQRYNEYKGAKKRKKAKEAIIQANRCYAQGGMDSTTIPELEGLYPNIDWEFELNKENLKKVIWIT